MRLEAIAAQTATFGCGHCPPLVTSDKKVNFSCM